VSMVIFNPRKFLLFSKTIVVGNYRASIHRMALPTFILPPQLADRQWVPLLREAGLDVQLVETHEGMAKEHYGYIIVRGASTLHCIFVPNWPTSTQPDAARADQLVIVPQQSLAKDELYATLKEVLLAAGATLK